MPFGFVNSVITKLSDVSHLCRSIRGWQSRQFVAFVTISDDRSPTDGAPPSLRRWWLHDTHEASLCSTMLYYALCWSRIRGISQVSIVLPVEYCATLQFGYLTVVKSSILCLTILISTNKVSFLLGIWVDIYKLCENMMPCIQRRLCPLLQFAVSRVGWMRG